MSSGRPQTLNQVAIWLPMRRDGLDVKTYDTYQYMHRGIIQSASSLAPVIRYAKNYTVKGQTFSLCLISLERDTKKMEDFLDEVSTKVKVEPGEVFQKTEFYYDS